MYHLANLNTTERKRGTMSGTNKPSLQLLERAITILDFIAFKTGSLSFTEIVEGTGISKPSVHRILATLGNFRILVRDEQGGYILGPRIIGWSRSCIQSHGLLSVAKPWLDRIWNEVGETLHLVSFEDEQAYYLFKMESRHPLQMRSRMGDPIALHSTAAGKAILFSLPEDKLGSILKKINLNPKTKKTITDPVALKEQLQSFRTQGFSEEVEENEQDIRCMAAPILNNRGFPVGAVSITCPTYRCDDLKAQKMGKFLAETLPNLSYELGYNPQKIQGGVTI